MVDNLNSTLAVDLNNWQFLGKARVFARKHVPKKYITVYMTIADFSVGFGNFKTHHKTIDWFSKEAGVARRTFVTHVAELQKLGFIKIVKPSQFVEGGGTIPNAYSLCFTVGKASMGYMNLSKDETLDKGEESTKVDVTGRAIELIKKIEEEGLDDDEEITLVELVASGEVIDTLDGLTGDEWERKYAEIKADTVPRYKLAIESCSNEN